MSSTLTNVPFSALKSTGPPVSGGDKLVAGWLPYIWNGIKWVSKTLGFKAHGGAIAPPLEMGHSAPPIGQLKRAPFRR
jgi:hypothetical protein